MLSAQSPRGAGEFIESDLMDSRRLRGGSRITRRLSRKRRLNHGVTLENSPYRPVGAWQVGASLDQMDWSRTDVRGGADGTD